MLRIPLVNGAPFRYADENLPPATTIEELMD